MQLLSQNLKIFHNGRVFMIADLEVSTQYIGCGVSLKKAKRDAENNLKSMKIASEQRSTEKQGLLL